MFCDLRPSLSQYYWFYFIAAFARHSRCRSTAKRIPYTESSVFSGILSRSTKTFLSAIIAYKFNDYRRNCHYHKHGNFVLCICLSYLRHVRNNQVRQVV